MIQRFSITGSIARFRQVKNGYLLTLREQPLSRLAKPQYHHLAIWGKKAAAIAAHLAKGVALHCSGPITCTQKDGTAYINYTIDTWRVLPRAELPKASFANRDDDFFTPSLRWEKASDRRYEGFA